MASEDILVDDDMEPDPELNRITNAILGAAIEVHRTLGPGFSEGVYANAMELEFTHRGIPFLRECPIEVMYRGKLVGKGRMDFLVEGKVVVDLKAIESFAPIHTAQMISYLRATRHSLGLLLNFNVRRLKDGIKRIAG